MMQWLRRRTLFQRIALALMGLAIAALVVSLFSRGTSRSEFLMLASLICLIAFRRELLWRVRNRLLLTYFLFGVIPLLLVGWALTLAAELLFAQVAAERIQHELEVRIEAVRSVAQNLALDAAHGATADLLERVRLRVPKLEAVVQVNRVSLRLPSTAAIPDTPPWIAPGFANLFEWNGRYFIGASERDGDTTVLAYVPLDAEALASLAPGTINVPALLAGEGNVDFNFSLSGSRIAMVEHGVRREFRPSGLGSPRSWWDIPIASVLDWKVQTSAGSTEATFTLVSRPSLLVGHVAIGRMASVALSVLAVVGTFFAIVETVSLFSTSRLMRTISRSVDDLYRGTLRVAQGDFAHQIPVRGKHQLSELAGSFNGMTERIQQLIGEVKKKEKLDAELEIARQVQLRLFPKSVPELASLEIAATCLPGRIVSGDYYDYVRIDNRWTAIALGDVSGKGVSAALLMASMQSALHAQLSFGAAADAAVISTATLMARISQQLYENTPPEKYATFFCSLYDDETGRLAYTNAGHLKPILVRDRQPSALEGDGMVAGLLPNVSYEQHEIALQAGDLLAMFSDGIPEAENAALEEFGEARLAELLVAHSTEPLHQIVAAVIATVEQWIHDPEGRDDLTLLLLRKV